MHVIVDAINNSLEVNGSAYAGSAAPMPTPEPGTMLLIGSGLLGIVAVTRKKQK